MEVTFCSHSFLWKILLQTCQCSDSSSPPMKMKQEPPRPWWDFRTHTNWTQIQFPKGTFQVTHHSRQSLSSMCVYYGVWIGLEPLLTRGLYPQVRRHLWQWFSLVSSWCQSPSPLQPPPLSPCPTTSLQPRPPLSQLSECQGCRSGPPWPVSPEYHSGLYPDPLLFPSCRVLLPRSDLGTHCPVAHVP